MSIVVTPKVSPAEELNLLLGLIPLNHPAKTEVSSYLTQIGNIQMGKKPDGSTYGPNEVVPSPDDLISQLTISALIDKGFNLSISAPSTQQVAIKNFVISAIKNGDRVDVGSAVAAFAPKEVMSMISKVTQTDIMGMNIYELESLALRKINDLETQLTSTNTSLQSTLGSLSRIAETYGAIPDVANTLSKLTKIAEAVAEIQNYVEQKNSALKAELATMEKEAEGDVDTPTTPEEPSSPGDLPEGFTAEIPPSEPYDEGSEDGSDTVTVFE